MANLMNTPLAQQARTTALQLQEARGTLNTGMAQQAADAAAYQALLPMAQQDAETYAALDALNANYDFQKDFLTMSSQFDMVADQLQLTSQERMQMTATLGSLYGDMIDNIGAIMRSKEMNAESKAQAIQDLYDGYYDAVETYANLIGWDIEWD